MNSEDIQKLATWLKGSIEDTATNHLAWGIKNPQYDDLYFDIFIKEINQNGEPIPYERFCDKLYEHLLANENINIDDHPKVLNDLITVWSAWVELYRLLKRSGYINSKKENWIKTIWQKLLP